MAKTFDVVVIGAGPGGYIAAIRAAQLGLQAACIDDWSTAAGKPAPGGTCTNVGCIPSKALLQSSENYEHAGHGFADHGIQVKGLAMDIAQMLKRKDKVVRQNNEGILYLFKKNKVTFYHGRGSFAGKGADGWQIKVSGQSRRDADGQTRDHRHRFQSARTAGCRVRQQAHPGQCRRAGDCRGAEKTRRHRRGRDRA